MGRKNKVFSSIYKNKRVLVTGHTGFKGSWLTAWLKELGAEISGLSLEPNTDPAHFTLLDLPINSHITDIRDAEKVRKILIHEQPEIVFHLAAQPLVRYSYETPLETFATNVMGTANILQACRSIESLKAIVVITSDKCYENREWNVGYRECDPMGGYDPYSASKGCAELVTSCFRNSFFNLEKFGKDHQILLASARAGNVIGGGDWAKDRLIPDMIRSVVANEKVQIRKPNATRPWQHVLECLSGYLRLGEQLLKGKPQFADAWNFAPNDEGAISVLEIVKKMHQRWKKIDFEVYDQIDHLHEAHYLKLDASKANSKLHWKAVWNLGSTLQITADWYRDFYENKKIATLDNIKQYCEDAKKMGLFL
jgi:CDP-glucose 4,6-dehydratase